MVLRYIKRDMQTGEAVAAARAAAPAAVDAADVED
jgi:hypothetical protein